MDLKKLIKDFENCPCGREHTCGLGVVEAGADILPRSAQILKENGFLKNLLVVCDKNTLKASDGILDILKDGGFNLRLKMYDDLRCADMTEVRVIESLLEDTDGVLSVGTGSLNDICRLASYRKEKPLAIFATAPSMDGFASDTAPITDNNFKLSYQAQQPKVIMADSAILAAAPAYLKSAGFGDMIGKYIGLVDWRVSNLVTGEYYCPAVADLTRRAADNIMALCDKITLNDEEAAMAVFESLLLTGIGMSFTHSSRPASGTEHIISHFWESKKLEEGIISDFHGKKVGVATLMTARIYHKLADIEEIEPKKEKIDWEEIKTAYGPNLAHDMMKFNCPTVTEETTPEKIKESWQKIRSIIKKELPTVEKLTEAMDKAGAAKTHSEIAVSDDLCAAGLKYHPYMRHRMTLMRLLPMLNIDEEKLK